VEFDSAAHSEAVEWACFQRGLLVLECGRATLRLAPALVVSQGEMDTALRLFGQAVRAVSAGDPVVASKAAALADPIEAAV
jgi:4-aminobutyrate aminotransferase